MRNRLAAVCLGALLTIGAAPSPELGWAFPDGRGKPPAGGWDHHQPVTTPGGAVTFVEGDLHDIFKVPDWRPKSHPAMPPAVGLGRRPDAYPCGFCHLPGGEGRPENAALAGLPRGYIVRQVRAFASGARIAADHDWFPSAAMAGVARAAAPREIDAAADYFSRLTFASRLKVVEAASVPAPRAENFLFVPTSGRPAEPLGARIVEAPSSMERFEHRDSQVDYTAYVPVGSLRRGGLIASGRAGVQACASCHGAGLKGGGLGPPLAGRSPTYLFRQLYGFQSGSRADPEAGAMKPIVAGLTPSDMIALAAYAGSLKP